MVATRRTTLQLGLRQQSLGHRCRLGRATALVFILASGVTLTLGGRAEAQDITWTGAGANDAWENSANWNPSLPVAGDDVVINTAPVTILTTAATVATTNISGAGALQIQGAGAALTSAVTITGGDLTVGGVGGGSLIGSVDLNSGSLAVQGTGTITGNVTVSGGTANVAGAVVGAADIEGGLYIANGGLSTLSGLATVTGGELRNNGGALNGGVAVEAGGTFNNNTGTAGAVTSAGTGSNSATVASLTVTGGTFENAGIVTGATAVSDGTLTLNSGTNLADGAGVSVSGTGTLAVNAADTVGAVTQSGGTIEGAATLTAASFSQTGGDMAGILNSAGNKTLEGGTISGTLGGAGLATVQGAGATTLSGTIASDIVVTGTLVLDGGIIDDGTPTHTVEIQQGGTVRAISDSTLDGARIDVIANETGTITAADGVTLTLATADIARRIDSTTTFGTAGVAGTVVIAPTSSISIGNNSVVNVAGGTLQVGTAFAGSVYFNSGLNISTSVDSGATIDINGFNTTIRQLSGAGSITNDGAAAATVTLNNPTGQNSDFSGVIEDGTSAVALTKSGAGAMTLSGKSTYTGITTVSAGSLVVTGSIGSNTVNVTGGILSVDGAALSNSAAVTLSGTGNLTLTGSETIGSLAGVAGTTVTLGANTLTTGGNNTTTTFGGVIGGTGGVTKAGTGTLTLTGVNTYEGLTNVDSGTLTISNGSTLGTTAAGTVVDAGATLALTGGITTGENLTLNGAGVGNGGALRGVSGVNTLNGTITLDSAARINTDGAVDTDELVLNGNITMNGNALTVGGTGRTTINGVIDSGSLTVDATTFFGVVALQGVNTFTGGTTITSGFLQLIGGSALADAGAVTINGGALQVFDGETIGALSGIGGQIILRTTEALVAGDATDTTFAGDIVEEGVVGTFTKAGTGTLTLSGVNTFAGGLTVGAGTVALAGGAALDDANAVTVETGATLSLIDSEAIGALSGLGAVDLSVGNCTADTVLTVNGAFAGGSVLRLDAVLGDDSSISDRVVITGDTSGTTSVFVNVLGGSGAPTSAGIQIVDVGGASDGSFVLANGDVMLPGNELGISAGTYVYALRNVAGDWFLQSQLQGFTVAYEAVPSALLGLTRAASLAQRLAGRSMAASPDVNGPDADGPRLSVSSRGGLAGSAVSGAWLTIRGSDVDVTPEASTAGLSYDQSTWRVQAGYDLLVSEGAAGSWVVGASVFTGGSDVQATSALGDGVIATDATGAGLTATWYGDNGFYSDLQLEYSRFESDLSSSAEGALATGVDGSGRFASVEVGRVLALANGLVLTPQAQISWADVSLDSFTGTDGSAVSLDAGDSLRLRLGLAAETSWTDGVGTVGRVYSIANIIREVRGETAVQVDDVTLDTSAPELIGELGMGVALDWQSGGAKTSLFGEVNAQHGFGGGDLSGVSGTAGLRLTW